MTGPFNCEEIKADFNEETGTTQGGKSRKNEEESSIIPDRPRCTIMGVILQQIDNNN